MTRWVARAAAVLALVVTGFTSTALPAEADAADCAATEFGDGNWRIFTPETRYLPPPLRGFNFDCAVQPLTADPHDPNPSYVLLWLGVTWDDFVAVVRSFEDSEWAEPGLITSIDPAGAAPYDSAVHLSADDLAAMSPAENATTRFSNDATRQDIIAMEYANGTTYTNVTTEAGPNLELSVDITSGGYESTGLSDPSRLSTLRTVFQVAPTPVQWGVIGAGSLMLMLVVGWPSALLNSVVGSRYQVILTGVRSRFRRRQPAAVPATAIPDPEPGAPVRPRMSRLPGWLMWPGFVIAALLGAFVDPDFGVNEMSVRLVITLFLSFVLFNLVAWVVVQRVARRIQPDSEPYLKFRWGSLIIVAIAVLVARLLQLEPGVIFGLVAGIAYSVTLQAAKSAIVTLVGSAIGLGLSLVGWVGYSLIAPIASDNAGNFVLVFLAEFLSGVTIKGISSLPLSLLPLGTLDGVKLLRWKKWIWGIAYAVGLAAFMLVLLTIPKAWGEIPGDFLRWLALFGGYAVIAIVIWVVNARMLARRPLPPEDQQGDQPDAITID